MKKSYFITWLGALSTVLVTALTVSRKIKKYGRRVYSDRLIKPSEESVTELIDKGIDLGLKKILK